MRIFFFKAVSLLIGVGLLSTVLGPLADRVAPLEDWRVEHQRNRDQLFENRESIEAITLGNSHSDSLDYSVMGIEGQSVALAAADLFEIEKYALTLVEELPRLETVFIAISYYSFSRDNAHFQSLESRRIGFYSMVPVWSAIEGDTQNFLLGKVDAYTHVRSVVRSDHWQGVLRRLFSSSSPESLLTYDGVRTTSAWGECSHYTDEQLDAHAFEIAGRNVSSSMEMAAAHPGLEQDTFDALSRTIERLKSRGIQVILFTPPYYRMYNEYFEEQGSAIIEQWRQETGRLQEIYQVPYYDFSRDAEIITHPELFYNSDHLSECGIKVFSEKLLQKMGEKRKLDRKVQPPLWINSSFHFIWLASSGRKV
jgi:hypothetical protein